MKTWDDASTVDVSELLYAVVGVLYMWEDDPRRRVCGDCRASRELCRCEWRGKATTREGR